MKPLLTTIAAALFLLLPSPGFTAYIIHLKDGTKFVTDQYFEEGDQIKFKRYGGLIGVEKERILEIEETEDLPQVEVAPAKAEVPLPNKEAGNQEATPDKPKGKLAQREGDGKDEKNREKVQVEGTRTSPEVIEKEEKKTEKEEAAKIAAILEEKRRLNNEMKRVYLEFKKAKNEGNNEARKNRLVEFGLLRKKFDELEEKVKNTYGGKLPDWWNESR